MFQDKTRQIEEGLRKLVIGLSMPTFNWLCLFVLMVHISVVGGTQNESCPYTYSHSCIYRTTRRRVCIYKIFPICIYIYINTFEAVVSEVQSMRV